MIIGEIVNGILINVINSCCSGKINCVISQVNIILNIKLIGMVISVINIVS